MTKTLAEQIEERKQQAQDRGIFGKAQWVADQLGTVRYSHDDDTETTVHTFNDAATSLVITQTFSEMQTRTRDSEAPDSYTDWSVSISYKGKEVFSAEGSFADNINSYIPGEWEQKLNALDAELRFKAEQAQAAAAKKAAAEEAIAKQAEEKAERAKWGLDETPPDATVVRKLTQAAAPKFKLA